jgi:hypothetical protein
MRDTVRGAILALLATAGLSTPAGAVPIPWTNCGAPGDALQITQATASQWPPAVAAPARANVTLDAAGNLLDLQLVLVHGVLWTFDTGPLPVTASSGFLALPASFSAGVTGPSLPLAAGPYVTTRTFTDNGASETIADKATVASAVAGPATGTIALSFNGTPGIALTTSPGDVYDVRVQAQQAGGGEVFCMHVAIPFKTATPFAAVQVAASAPALSGAGALTLIAMLLATGFTAFRWRARGRAA